MTTSLIDRLPTRIRSKILVCALGNYRSEHWLWGGAQNNKGYGMVNSGVHAKTVLAHRLVYELLVGRIRKNRELDHKCRITACVNPDHLEQVSHAENMARGINATRPFCVNGHPRTAENTYLRKDKNSKQCRICNTEKNQRRYRPTGVTQNGLKTQCKRGHLFSPENTRWLRGGTARQCKTCEKIR